MELIFGLIRFFRWLDKKQRESQAAARAAQGGAPPSPSQLRPQIRPQMSVPVTSQQAQSQSMARPAPAPIAQVRAPPPRQVAKPNNASIVDDAPVGAVGSFLRLFEGRRD